ncbi:MAG: Glycerophosphoryl diester phosphodiesterase, rane domain protein [Frankiales bacterium]|nr:Glycerophosphoryl diester phosphodiesterase, rane domain protein [Frankiales bacterium]
MTNGPQGWASPDEEPSSHPYGGTPPYGYGEAPPGPPPYAPGSFAPRPGVVPLRPLGVGELLDGAVKIVRRYPRPTLGLSAAIALVVTAINLPLVLLLSDPNRSSGNASTPSQAFDQGLMDSAARVPGGLIGYLAGLVLSGAIVLVVGRAVLGQDVSAGELWSSLRPRLAALLGLSLLTGLSTAAPAVLGIGLALLIGPAGLVLAVPGVVASVYLYTRLSLAPAAMVLEKSGPVTALRRSGVLVRGSWWRVFGILVLTSIIGSVVAAVVAAPVGILAALASSPDSTAFLVVAEVVGGLASVLVSPFTAGVHALLYVDRRMRAEGLDVALQASVATASSP